MWRQAAIDARLKAARTADPVVRQMLLDIADQYDTLIREVLTDGAVKPAEISDAS